MAQVRIQALILGSVWIPDRIQVLILGPVRGRTLNNMITGSKRFNIYLYLMGKRPVLSKPYLVLSS